MKKLKPKVVYEMVNVLVKQMLAPNKKRLHHKSLLALTEFIKWAVIGIACARTVILTKVALQISKFTKRNVKSIHNWLLEHLGNYELKAVCGEGLMRYISAYLATIRYVVIDATDIAKPYGRKFEGMGKVRDASSKDKKITRGYRISIFSRLIKSSNFDNRSPENNVPIRINDI